MLQVRTSSHGDHAPGKNLSWRSCSREELPLMDLMRQVRTLSLGDRLHVRYSSYGEHAVVVSYHVFLPCDIWAKRGDISQLQATLAPLFHLMKEKVRNNREIYQHFCSHQGCRGLMNMGLEPLAVPPPSNYDHKCRLLHQDDPYTRLGPFKMEVRISRVLFWLFLTFWKNVKSKSFCSWGFNFFILKCCYLEFFTLFCFFQQAYYWIFRSFLFVQVARLNPFIMVLHDLLSEEDINHLITWATPRLSRYSSQ